VTTATTAVLAAAPSAADPSVGNARHRVATLHHQTKKLNTDFKHVSTRLHDSHLTLAGLRAARGVQQDRLADLRQAVSQGVVDSFEGDAPTTSPTGAEESPLTTVSEYTQEQRDAIDGVESDISDLSQRVDAVRARIDSLRADKTKLVRKNKALGHRANHAEDVLSRVREELRQQREERLSRSGSRTPTTVSSTPASGSAGAAVSYAMAQLGDSYVYGAAGPDAFDCSGLTMMAWSQAGVSLPHSSSAQMGYGTPVSTSSLQPGDLVFYYSPVSHVAIYIGNGMIVHAANPSTGVVEAPVGSMPIAGAVRPG
jgi:cell wall-associated NlpC family hydrolase